MDGEEIVADLEMMVDFDVIRREKRRMVAVRRSFMLSISNRNYLNIL